MRRLKSEGKAVEGHKYNASDFEYLDKYAQEYFASLEAENNSPSVYRGSTAETGGSIINTSLCDSDVNPLAPICIGMDYNANINWIVAGQPEGRRYILLLLREFCSVGAWLRNLRFIGFPNPMKIRGICLSGFGNPYIKKRGMKNIPRDGIVIISM